MADPVDNCALIEEVREIASVLCDQVEVYGYKNKETTATTIETMTQEVKDGKRFVLGQLVQIRSYKDANTYGGIHAIVTGIKRVSASNIEYSFTGMGGDLNFELFTAHYMDTKVLDVIKAEPDGLEILDAITTGKLGRRDIKTMKDTLNIPHIFVLNVGEGKFHSHF